MLYVIEKIKKENMINKYAGAVESAFALSYEEENDLENFPEVTRGSSISFSRGASCGCSRLFLQETDVEEHLSPLCFSEEDYFGSTADGRVVVLRVLDYDMGDVGVGIFISSTIANPEEIQKAIDEGKKPLFYRAEIA